MSSFSERQGITPEGKQLQLEYIDDELRNGLWNVFLIDFIDTLDVHLDLRKSEFKKFAELLWHHHFKAPIDEIPYYQTDAIQHIRNYFFRAEWYEVYNFIEFISSIMSGNLRESFMSSANDILKREFSGYLFINDIIAPISNELESAEITEAFNNTKSFTSLDGANIHLSKALDFISDKKNPNYRNSIKESIQAIEATCRIITGENTLGKALKNLENSGIDINNQLKAGFVKIYAYSNDKDTGIRHAIVISPKEPDFADAKYMLISCSSFINYLILKASDKGLKLN